MRIVGLVGDVKHAGLDWGYLPEIYLPYRQLSEREYEGLAPEMYLVVRGRGRISLNNEIRSAVWSLDRSVPVVDMMGMKEIVATKELPSQSNTAIFASFAGISLLLAAVGLYAIVSQSVLQRRKEIGIRVALGASARNVIGNTVREGIVLAATGATVGLAGAAAVTHLLRSMLFGVATTDPCVFVAVPLLLLLVATSASLLPAIRAASADPLEALRCD
jgi:putative ABC transport system permease protein